MAQQSTIGVRPSQPGASRSTDRTLVQIRERSYLEVLDLALVVVRQWPLTLGLAALAGIAPFAVFNVWLLSDPEVPVGLLVYLLVLEAPWATAPLTVVLGGLMFGDRPSMGRVVRTLVRSFPSMFLFQFLARAFFDGHLLPLLPGPHASGVPGRGHPAGAGEVVVGGSPERGALRAPRG